MKWDDDLECLVCKICYNPHCDGTKEKCLCVCSCCGYQFDLNGDCRYYCDIGYKDLINKDAEMTSFHISSNQVLYCLVCEKPI